MKPLSVTIIARDEADRIGAAIASVGFADEILVLDCGSEDDTVGIATRAGARVLQTDWPGFVAQRNRATDAAAHDWVLSLDADERVDPKLAAEIQAALKSPKAAGFLMSRLGHWMGAPVHHGTWRPDRSVRLFDRRQARWTGGAVHERVEVQGGVDLLEGDLLHHPYRNLREHWETVNRYADLFVEQAQRTGKVARWGDVLIRPPAHLVKALVIRRGILDGFRGLCIAVMGAIHVGLKWGRLYRASRGGQR